MVALLCAGEHVSVASAASPQSEYRDTGESAAVASHDGEDPFLWQVHFATACLAQSPELPPHACVSTPMQCVAQPTEVL